MESARAAAGRARGELVKRLIAVIVLLGWGAAARGAPPFSPDGKWWKNTRVVRELALTGPQIDRIERIFLRVRPALIDLRADLEKKRLLQDAAMEQPNVDTAEASRRIDDVEQARSKLEKARAMMFLAIREVLTPEQRQKARGLIEERRERRGLRARPR